MVIVINAAEDDFDIHSSDELPLFADKGDSGILAEESTAPTYNGKVIWHAVINIKTK